jgi:hypothetical protein
METTPTSSTPGQLPGVVQLITEAKNLVMKRLGYFISLTLVTEVFGPLVLVGLLMALFALGGFVYAITQSLAVMVVLGIIAVAAIVFLIYAQILFAMAPMFAVSDETMLGIKQSIMAGKPKVGTFFLTSLLMGLLILVGFVLLVVPGIYLAIALSFSVWFVVLEGVDGTEALKKSKELVEGRWFAVFGRWIIAGVAVWLLFAIPAGIFQAIGFEFLGGHTIIMTVFIAPMMTAYSYLLYKALKQAKLTGPINPV